MSTILISIQYMNVTDDGRTDGQTPHDGIVRVMACIVMHSVARQKLSVFVLTKYLKRGVVVSEPVFGVNFVVHGVVYKQLHQFYTSTVRPTIIT